jgi:hypothetical protein
MAMEGSGEKSAKICKARENFLQARQNLPPDFARHVVMLQMEFWHGNSKDDASSEIFLLSVKNSANFVLESKLQYVASVGIRRITTSTSSKSKISCLYPNNTIKTRV